MTIRDILNGLRIARNKPIQARSTRWFSPRTGRESLYVARMGAMTQWKTNNLEILGEFDKQLSAIRTVSRLLLVGRQTSVQLAQSNKQTLVD